VEEVDVEELEELEEVVVYRLDGATVSAHCLRAEAERAVMKRLI